MISIRLRRLYGRLSYFHNLFMLFPAEDTGPDTFVFQHFPEPIYIVTEISKQPVDIRQATEQRPRADVVADLSRLP